MYLTSQTVRARVATCTERENIFKFSFKIWSNFKTKIWILKINWEVSIDFILPSHWCLGRAFHLVLMVFSRICRAKYFVCWFWENSKMVSTLVHASGCSLSMFNTSPACFCYSTNINLNSNSKIKRDLISNTVSPCSLYIKFTTLSNRLMSSFWLKSNKYFVCSIRAIINLNSKV